jgi:hypothetical protein
MNGRQVRVVGRRPEAKLTATHRPLYIVFVRLRIAEVDEDAIAPVLREQRVQRANFNFEPRLTQVLLNLGASDVPTRTLETRPLR